MNPYEYFGTEFDGKYYIQEWGHALAILKHEFPEQFSDLCGVLASFELRKSNIMKGGGGKSKVSGYLDHSLYDLGWAEKKFDTLITIDGESHETPTHKIDCVKGKVALDIEWNNKTEFYDRDLGGVLNHLSQITVAASCSMDR